jgi:hypothetical protein
MLTVTWMIGEKTLFLVGLSIYGPLTALLATTIVMRWRQGQSCSLGGNLEAREGVILGGGMPTNGRGSLPAEAVWKDLNPN